MAFSHTTTIDRPTSCRKDTTTNNDDPEFLNTNNEQMALAAAVTMMASMPRVYLGTMTYAWDQVNR